MLDIESIARTLLTLAREDRSMEPDVDIDSMDTVTAKLIERVQQVEKWVKENPEHEQVAQWTREIMLSALYIENEYSYVESELREVEENHMNRISEHVSSSSPSLSVLESVDGNLEEQIEDIIERVEDQHEIGAPVDEVLMLAEQSGLERNQAEDALESLRQKGKVYEPQTDHLRMT